MEQFEIVGKPFWNRFYKKWMNYFTEKFKSTQNLIVNPLSVKLPTPHLIVIKFSLVNKNEKYELAIQGDWRNWYTEMSNNPDLKKPSELDIENAIRAHFEKAYRLKYE